MVEYSAIAHLVTSFEHDEHCAYIKYCSDCSKLEKVVTVPISAPSDSGAAGKSKPSLLEWVQMSLARMVRPQNESQELEDAQKERLVLEGFTQFQDQLQLVGERWLRCRQEQHPSERFERQLNCSPVVDAYDLEVLVRVLLEISRSDSELRAEERNFLAELVQDENLVARLSKAPKITVAELSETSSGDVKNTILMLAWAMAYADGHLDAEEMKRLKTVCRGFMLPEKRVVELQMAAKLFLLDRHFNSEKEHQSAQALRDSFEAKAEQWGVTDVQLEELRTWYPCLKDNQV